MLCWIAFARVFESEDYEPCFRIDTLGVISDCSVWLPLREMFGHVCFSGRLKTEGIVGDSA